MRLFISILLIFKIKNIIAKTDTPPMIENDAALLPVIKNNILAMKQNTGYPGK